MAQYKIDPQGFFNYYTRLSSEKRHDAMLQLASSMVAGKTSKAKWLTRITKSKKSSGQYTEDFLAWWAEYPKKTGKGAAFAVWSTLGIATEACETMIQALKWQKHSRTWVEGYIPLPETYLRQRRFEDEPEAPPPNKTMKVY